MATKSSVVSGMGLAMSIITNLVKAVQKAGGTDEDIHRLATPEGEGLLERMAGMVVQTKSVIEATFRVVVDYSQSFLEMITAGKYDRVNSGITADHFPVIRREGRKETEVVLFYFGMAMRSEQVIAEIEKSGCHPAKIEELLALGASQPDLQKEFPIVTLGSVWQIPNGRCVVPYLGWGDAGRRHLDLNWVEYAWGGHCRFAAVRK